jgi:hypothetical protein
VGARLTFFEKILLPSERSDHGSLNPRATTRAKVVPVLIDNAAQQVVAAEARAAAVALLTVGADWRTAKDFGNPTAELAEVCACPTFVVRPQETALPAAPEG